MVHEYAQYVPCEHNIENNCWNRGKVIVYISTLLTCGWVSSLINWPEVNCYKIWTKEPAQWFS